jgi:hypothetical protein
MWMLCSSGTQLGRTAEPDERHTLSGSVLHTVGLPGLSDGPGVSFRACATGLLAKAVTRNLKLGARYGLEVTGFVTSRSGGRARWLALRRGSIEALKEAPDDLD